MTESCLTTRLENFIQLTESEKEFVAYMEREERSCDKREKIIRIGDNVEHLHVLKFGWAVVRGREIRGRSSVLRIYLPGEVIGLAELGRTVAIHSLEMQTDGMICPFPRSAVAKMFERAPRLSALLMSISSLDQLALREQVVGLARMTAEDRLIQFLVTLRDRLSVANAGTNNRFHLPLSQAELGDVLGLTSIYVNRLLRDLRRSGKIEVEGDHIKLLDREGLEEQVDYSRVLSQIDTSWFPETSA